ncbi:MAG: DNA helicase UvrD [Candidatus Aenigmarchaeota archaeon]|nr:DNA helicase UvrD [Candidatus Aenigmarchaeota archaeon]
MKYIADFHLHSSYSRATSKNLNLDTLSEGAKIKGLDILGTGDWTHPLWLKELKEKLEPVDDTGIFSYNGIHFTLAVEVATLYYFENKYRHIHHNIHVSSFDIVDQINDIFSKFGNLSADGRPILKLSSAEMVERLMGIDKKILIYPNHAWTPWRAVFGKMGGFNSLEECYQDQLKNIFALETGLSSDPEMNWRLSKLDDITLLSNSDAHSANPWRIGREANVFDFKKLSYDEIFDTIKKKDNKRFLYTIEVDPNYGKYHFSGHRDCNISLGPKDAIKLNNKCPKCGKKLTMGVLQRVEELADREEGYVPKNHIPFKSLLPLYEVISFVTGVSALYSKKVIAEQDKLIGHFESEMNVLLDAGKEELLKVTNDKIADAIIKVREGKVKFEAGYDGVYGKPVFDGVIKKKTFIDQKSLSDFKGSVV